MISLPVSELRIIVNLILDTYSSAILKVLARCDQSLTEMQKTSGMSYDTVLLDGMNVRLLQDVVIILDSEMETTNFHAFLRKGHD